MRERKREGGDGGFKVVDIFIGVREGGDGDRGCFFFFGMFEGQTGNTVSLTLVAPQPQTW